MTSREKNLGIAVGVVATIFIGYWGANQYQQARTDLDRQIQKKKEERNAVDRDRKRTVERADLWRDYGRQTLSMDPNEVQTRLRNELHRLAEECNLKDVRLTISRVTPVGKPSRKQKNFVRVLGASLDADGQMGDLVRFLFRLHGRPYQVRLKNLTLAAVTRGKVEKGTVHLKASLETPILPPTKLVPRVFPDKPDVPEEQEKPRTVLASLDDYSKAIVKRKIHLPYENVVIKAANAIPANGTALPQPEQPTVDLRWTAAGPGVIGYKVHFNAGAPTFRDPPIELARSQSTIRREGLKPGTYYWRVDTIHEDWEGVEVTTKGDVWNFRVNPKPPPPATRPVIVRKGEAPPPPPPDAHFTVARILSSPMGQYVILEDRRTRNNPRPPERKVEVGEPLFDGILVYLHPRGVVSEKVEEGKAPEWRFHPIGTQVQQGMTPQTEFLNKYGDIYNELVKLRDKYTGITQRPADSANAGG
jgi:hypothetical protein